jgi:hypothetical protein
MELGGIESTLNGKLGKNLLLVALLFIVHIQIKHILRILFAFWKARDCLFAKEASTRSCHCNSY